jgi:hypothetical protein
MRKKNMKSRIQFLVFSFMMFIVVACGSDVNTPDANDIAGQANGTEVIAPATAESGIPGSAGRGKAEFTFSGGINETFTGEAMHMIQETSAGGVFQLAIYSYQDENNFTAISISNMKGKADLGDFALTDDSEYLVGFMQNVAGVMSVGGLNSGQLSLAAGGNSGLSGTLSFEGDLVTGSNYEDSRSVTVAATFEAAAGTTEDLPKGLGARGE